MMHMSDWVAGCSGVAPTLLFGVLLFGGVCPRRPIAIRIVKVTKPEQAIAAAGLVLNQRQDVVFAEGRPPTIAVFSCSFTGLRADAAPLVMRLKNGEYGPDRFMLKDAMGFGK